MSATALAGAVELLDRSLAFTRLPLSTVQADHLGLATPCRGWPLAVLLAHLDDSLDAWTEASTGRVSLTAPSPGSPLEAIRAKACALLGWWLAHPPEEVAVGDLSLPAPTLVAAAALEITVHGWDVQATLGPPVAVPPELASPLLRVARVVVDDPPTHGCFSTPLLPPPDASPSDRLLARLGRR